MATFWNAAEEVVNDWGGVSGSRIAVIRQGRFTRRFLAEPASSRGGRHYRIYEQDTPSRPWEQVEEIGYPGTLTEAERAVRAYAAETEKGHARRLSRRGRR
jgi:hypothetical protein